MAKRQKRRRQSEDGKSNIKLTKLSGDPDAEIDSFDNVESMSAAEYLAKVSQQAKHMPTFFVSGPQEAKEESITTEKTTASLHNKPSSCSTKSTFVPIDGSAASIAYLFSRQSFLAVAPSEQHLPPNVPLFSRTCLENFQRLRNYLEQCQAQGIGGKQDSNRRPVPPMKCRDSWYTFCCGPASCGDDDAKKESDSALKEEVPQSATEMADSESIGNPTDSTSIVDVPLWKSNLSLNGHAPSVRLVLQMDQVMVRQVLSHLAFSFRTSSSNGKLLEWIYALLARLEKPVHRDDAAILFGLLKDLCLARSQLDCKNGTKDLKAWNVLIVVIAVYFEQVGDLDAVMTTGSADGEMKKAPTK